MKNNNDAWLDGTPASKAERAAFKQKHHDGIKASSKIEHALKTIAGGIAAAITFDAKFSGQQDHPSGIAKEDPHFRDVVSSTGGHYRWDGYEYTDGCNFLDESDPAHPFHVNQES